MAKKIKRTFEVIMSAAGRDFHNFNMVYRDDPDRPRVQLTMATLIVTRQ